jgi:mannose-1-phosphate guanylyltransferase/mannose-6-phosphate isomerase
MRKVAVVLSGGKGTRLWPMSTDEHPKQFLPLFGGVSLYQRTLRRLSMVGCDAIVVIGNANHASSLATQAHEIGLAPPVFLFEPAPRDSAAAVAAGMAWVAQEFGDDAVVFVLPCDHLIPDEAAFAADLAAAGDLAALGYLGTFGIQPTLPSTDFGYIQRGERIESHPSAFQVVRFHEKPRRDVAELYLAASNFYWNSGMFAFPVGLFRSQARQFMPAVWDAASAAIDRGSRDNGSLWLDPDAFMAAPKTSIDYGLMEKSSCVAVIPASFRWSDVGTWAAVHDAGCTSAADNVTRGNVSLHDVTGSLILADGVRVLAAGIDGLVVVATREGVFIAPKPMASAVKTLLGG